MYYVSMFVLLRIKKLNPITAYKISHQILKLTSVVSAIVANQHNYDFMPTTQRQINV